MEFHEACAAGDAAEVQSQLAEDPSRATRAAAGGRTQTLRAAADLGLPLDQPGDLRATPLHHAAWNGRAEAARVLLQAGVPLEVRDGTFDATPLGWACHGSLHGPPGDHAAVVREMLAAGAAKPPQAEASPEILALL